MCAILKERTANYISLESLINVDFGKKYELLVVLIPQKEIAKMTAKMTMRHSVKQNAAGYQNAAGLCEIWPEHSLDVVKQKRVGDF